MEIELTTSSARRLEDFLTGKLPSVKLLAAYFLRQCGEGRLHADNLYALDKQGGLVAVDVQSLLSGEAAQGLNEKLEEGYYQLIEALSEFPDLLEEKYHIFMFGEDPEAGKRPLSYYALLDLSFERVGKQSNKLSDNQLQFDFEPEERPEYRMVYKKKRLTQSLLKQRFLQEELHEEFGYIVAEMKNMGLKLRIPQNKAAIKAYHQKTGQEIAMVYPAGDCFGFEIVGTNGRKKDPMLFQSYGAWLANCLKVLKQYMAQQELFSMRSIKT